MSAEPPTNNSIAAEAAKRARGSEMSKENRDEHASVGVRRRAGGAVRGRQVGARARRMEQDWSTRADIE